MGCAPSIHVSQSTGVVYSKTDSTQNSQQGLSAGALTKRLSTASVSISEVRQLHRESLTTELRILRFQGCRKNSLITTTTQAWVSIEQQGKQTQLENMPQLSSDEAAKYELQLGPMKVYKQAMEILLVFGVDDAQSDAFLSAAKRGNYKCKLQYTAESAMEHYIKRLPELVIIDIRSNSCFDGETLCRNIRATRPNVNTVIVGITKRQEREEISVAPLLKAGFSKRFVEDHCSTACLNELLTLDHGEVSSQCKLKATSCLFSAVEHAYDAIEIQCIDPEKTEFQYVNPAYEKVTGYWRSEMDGNINNSIFSNCELLKPDSHENIVKLLSSGKSWEGVCIAHKKSGEQFVQNLKIVPMIGHAGCVTHYVIVKRDLTAVERDSKIQLMHKELNIKSQKQLEKDLHHQHFSSSIDTGSGDISVLNSVSMTAEAPITKVINMLNAVQENSPVNVVQVLERVIDILRTTELYTPATLDRGEGGTDFGADLVEGLMWNFRERRHSAESSVKGFYHRDSSSGTSLMNSQKTFQVMQASPDILEALQGDDQWGYNVINLEKVSNKRPLYYLGQIIFNRFDVGAYLFVSDSTIRNWLQLVEANYHSRNTYHNSTHAADVLHATAVFLQLDEVKNTLDRSDQVAALIAAVIHDVDHPGFTNSFLCNAGSELAVLYNDIAVLESHHSAMAFKLTARDAKSNIFQNLTMDEFKLLRQSIIDMVMATEMKQHFEHLAKFDNSFNKRHPAHEHDNISNNGRGTPESTAFAFANVQTSENRAVVRRMIIKCADIANPTRPFDLCREWAYRIAEEYFRQTEEEEKRNLPIVMPVFDRNTCNVPKSQIFFIDYFVMNLYATWDKFAHVSEAMAYLKQNYKYWSEQAEQPELEKEESST